MVTRFPVIFEGDVPSKWLSARNEIIKLLRKENCIEVIENDEPKVVKSMPEPEYIEVDKDSYVKKTPNFGKTRSESEMLGLIGTQTNSDFQFDEVGYSRAVKIQENDFLSKWKIYQSFVETTEKRQSKWNDKKAKAFKVIEESIGLVARGNVDEEIKNYNPKLIIEKLDLLYKSTSSEADQGSLMSQVTNIRIGDSEPFGVFCTRLNDLISGLESGSSKIQDSWKISFLVNGLERNITRSRVFNDDIKNSRISNHSYIETISHIKTEEIIRLSKRYLVPNMEQKSNGQILQRLDVPYVGQAHHHTNNVPNTGKSHYRSNNVPNTEITENNQKNSICKRCGGQHNTKYCKNKLDCTK